MNPEDKKNKSNKRLLQLSALMSALGAGSYAFGKGFDNPEISKAMSDFRNYDTASPYSALKGYTTFGSRLLNTPMMYGALKPIDFMKALRSFPIGPAGVASGLMTPEEAKWGPGQFEHYKNFQLGPMHGMAKLMEELSGGLGKERDKNLANVRDALNTFVFEKTQIPNYFNRAYNQESDPNKLPILNISRYFNEPLIDKKIQAQLALEFPDWVLSKEKYAPVKSVMDSANIAAKNHQRVYSNDVLGRLESLSRSTKLLGAGLGLAGAGLGAYGLYKHFKNKKQEKEKGIQEKVEQE